MKQSVLLVGNYPPDQQKSMTAFAGLIYSCLIADGHIVKILNPAVRLLPKDVKPRGFWKWVGYIDKFLLFPFELKLQANKFDCVHICDHSNAMYALLLKNIPTIVTCHDVLAIEAARDLIPGWQVGFMGKIFQRLIFKGLTDATAVVCDSEYTKSHLQSLGWSGNSISVALLSLNADFYPVESSIIKEAIKVAGLQADAKYLMHVGSDLPRKNRLFVLKTFIVIKGLFPEEDYKLLFVGPPLSAEMTTLLIDNKLSDSIFSIQDASHPMLRALYSGAVGLIFPSLQEGFGWPIIEAQACGCPVFTSNFSPMTEVGGAGAIYIDTLNAYIAADSIGKSLSNIELIRQTGFENIELFSTQNMMDGYQSAYMRALGCSEC